MALDPTIRQFQASGVYRLLINNSRLPDQPVDETLRLVVGFSKNGPFNTVVFVPDTEFFTSVYGERDRTLERQGSWFHLTALISLLEGPVFCLNLLSLNDELDLVQYKGFSLSSTEINDPLISESYSNFYNTDKFYFPSDNEFTNITKENSNNPKLFNLVNLNKLPITVILKKSEVSGFDVTAKEWYGTELDEIPTFLNHNDYISDYNIDVIVLKGDFTNFNTLKNDVLLGEFFDEKGLIKEMLEEFLLVPEVTVLDRYNGSLIPDFIDKVGNPLFIETLINQDTTRTGLFCTINQEVFDQEYLSGGRIDLVGHGIEKLNSNTIDFLSYSDTLKENVSELRVGNPISTIDVNPSLNADSNIRPTVPFYAIFAGTIGNYVDTSGLIGSGDTVITVNNGVISAHTIGPLNLNYGTPFNLTAGDTISRTGSNNVVEYRIVVQTSPGVLVLEDSNIKETIVLTNYTNSTGTVITNGEIRIGRATTLAQSIVNIPTWYYKRASDGKFIQPFFLDQQLNSDFIIIRFTASITLITGNLIIVSSGVNYLEFISPVLVSDPDYYIVGEDHPYYVAWANGEITSGDSFVGGNFVNFVEELESNFIKLDGSFTKRVKIESYLEETFITQTNVPALISVTSSTSGIIGNGTTIISLNGDLNRSIKVIGYLDPTDLTKVLVDNTSGAFAGKLKIGEFVVNNYGLVAGQNSRLTRVVSITPNPADATQLVITALENIAINDNSIQKTIERYKEVQNFIKYYVPTLLNGFSLRPQHLPNNTNARMNEILSPLVSGGVYEGLKDREIVQFRYLVDTFNHGIEANSKSIYGKLAKKRENIICLLNAPTWEEFKASTNPSFRRAPTLEVKQYPVETRYIVSGGNLDRNPSVIYSLPGEKDGGIYMVFFGPNVIMRDRAKDISVPPAMFAAANYTRKFINNNPWSIVAGPRRGVLNVPNFVGMEQPLTESDRGLLENMGINTIIDKRDVGPMITSNSTAKQKVKSTLSQVHAVDTVIYIQDGISNILSNFVWEFNTPLVRREILDLADQFLLSVLNGGGITEFRNVMDETNNSSDIIENNYGIIDTEIEVTRGMGIIVHRTTVQRNGQISGQLL